MDLPNHDASKSYPKIQAAKASQIIWEALSELKQHFDEISVFAHSLAGCLLYNASPPKGLKLYSLVFCGVPFDLNKSDEFQRRKQALGHKGGQIESNEQFVSYFNSLAPLYFLNIKKYEPIQFWPNGSFWENGQDIQRNLLPVSESIQHIKMPTSNFFIFDGDSDWVTPDENMTMFAASTENIKVEPIPNSGHFPFIEQPQLVINALKKNSLFI